jgi:CheY-like chemotaxis protein/HPt (histidine-containing phosphotransfer) domain-containing protein
LRETLHRTACGGMEVALEIIIVDDEPVSLTVLKNLVGKIPDCRPRVFAYASAALAWCKSNEPDLIIVDYMMPEFDGIEFTRCMREDARSAIPMLMVSANAEASVRERALETGVNGFLTKPFGSVELQARVDELLAQSAGEKKPVKERSPNAESGNKPLAAPTSNSHTILDVHATLARLGGDASLVGDVARVFTKTVPPLLALLREAVRDGNLQFIYEGAHSLKGAVGAVDAPTVLESVIELETHARKRDQQGVSAALCKTQSLMIRLLSELAEMVTEEPKDH